MEIWKDIPGHKGRYQVSDEGRVRNSTRRLLKPSAHRDGYLRVKLCAAGKSQTVFVHRLVAIAFLNVALSKGEVDHLDCDKRNNTASNLEWVDRFENMQRAARCGRLIQPDNSGENNGSAKITASVAREIRAAAGTATQEAIGRRFGISRRAVGMILSGQRWAHV